MRILAVSDLYMWAEERNERSPLTQSGDNHGASVKEEDNRLRFLIELQRFLLTLWAETPGLLKSIPQRP